MDLGSADRTHPFTHTSLTPGLHIIRPHQWRPLACPSSLGEICRLHRRNLNLRTKVTIPGAGTHQKFLPHAVPGMAPGWSATLQGRAGPRGGFKKHSTVYLQLHHEKWSSAWPLGEYKQILTAKWPQSNTHFLTVILHYQRSRWFELCEPFSHTRHSKAIFTLNKNLAQVFLNFPLPEEVAYHKLASLLLRHKDLPSSLF